MSVSSVSDVKVIVVWPFVVVAVSAESVPVPPVIENDTSVPSATRFSLESFTIAVIVEVFPDVTVVGFAVTEIIGLVKEIVLVVSVTPQYVAFTNSVPSVSDAKVTVAWPLSSVITLGLLSVPTKSTLVLNSTLLSIMGSSLLSVTVAVIMDVWQIARDKGVATI